LPPHRRHRRRDKDFSEVCVRVRVRVGAAVFGRAIEKLRNRRKIYSCRGARDTRRATRTRTLTRSTARCAVKKKIGRTMFACRGEGTSCGVSW
jgi:predicted SprT family Zn-dependent metalloprotease